MRACCVLLPEMCWGGLSFRVGLIRRLIKLTPLNDLIPAFECMITAEIIGDSCRSKNLFENFFNTWHAHYWIKLVLEKMLKKIFGNFLFQAWHMARWSTKGPSASIVVTRLCLCLCALTQILSYSACPRNRNTHFHSFFWYILKLNSLIDRQKTNDVLMTCSRTWSAH